MRAPGSVEALEDAVEETQNAGSFRVTQLSGISDDDSLTDTTTGATESDSYQEHELPDRIRMVTFVSEGTPPEEMIGVGADIYTAVDERPGFYVHESVDGAPPLAADIQDLLASISDALSAGLVEQADGVFVLSRPATDSTGTEEWAEVTIAEGKIHRLRLRSADADSPAPVFEFSHYGSVPPIERPAPSQLVDPSDVPGGVSRLEACGPDGMPAPGEIACENR